MPRMRKAGRPKKKPAQAATRDLVLKAARKVFADHGYHGTSLDEVAAVVDIRVPSLLYHYPTKQALYEAVVHDLAAEVNGVLDKIDLAEDDPNRKFRNALIELALFERRERTLIPIVLSETFAKDSPVQGMLVNVIEPMLDRVEKYFQENLKPPLSKKAPFREVAVMFLLAYAARAVLGKNAARIWGEEDHFLPLALAQMQTLQQWSKK